MRFHPLEKLINLHDGYRQSFRIDELHVLLLQLDGDVHLIEASCPHRAHPLSNAIVSDGVIQCDAHHYRFSLSDGVVLHSSEEPCRNLRLYTPVYQYTEVGIMIDDESV